MKSLSFPALGFLALGFAGNLGLAQTYNFESSSSGSLLSGQSGWSSNDANQADGVENLQTSFFPGTPGTNSGVIGGFWTDESDNPITPSSRTTLLNASVTSTPSSLTPLLRLRWIQNISNTDQDNGKRDSFGWTVRSGSTGLLSLLANPDAPTSNDMTVVASAGEAGSSLLPSSYTPNIPTIARGSAYAFELVLNPNAWTWSAKISGSFSAGYESINDWATIVQNAGLGGTSGSLIDGFAATWITQDANPANAGRNVMAFDNVEITTIVPEPSSLALFTFGSLSLLAARRRSRS